MLSSFGRGHAQCNKGNLGQKGFPHSPHREGLTHYVTEVLNSLFFNFDALPFILCSVGSLRIVFLTQVALRLGWTIHCGLKEACSGQCV